MTASISDVLAGRAHWALEHADGLALASTLAPGSVDHIIADPPYDKRTHERARSLKDGGSDIQIDFDPLESFAFVPSLIQAAKRWVICFCALEQLGEYSKAAGEECWIRSGVWHKTNPTPMICGDRPGQGAEGIAIMHGTANAKRWNRGGHSAHWTGPIETSAERYQPTQKPGWLMRQLILDFTDPDDLVFDPTAGAATTGVACLALGRRFIGCDLDADRAAVARERLEAARDGLTLREKRQGQQGLFLLVREAQERALGLPPGQLPIGMFGKAS